jgi:perosamine synthetase
MKRFIPVNKPLLNGNEQKYLNQCIKSGWISSEGPFVKKFESKFSKKMGRKYGIAVTNGTAALDAAIEAIGIKKGDEVILPTFTIISCVLQIIRNGGIPVLVDADPHTWNMNINQVEKKITSFTKAIMVVHIYGLPVDMDPIEKICKKYKLKLIEDSAELIGQKYNKKPCGSFGDISTVSFYPNKHVTTGEGGMILTNNYRLAEKCRKLRNLCFQEKKRFIHKELGWNLRMTNIQAALGLAQLERLDKFIKKKREIGKLYNNLLSDIPNLQLPVKKTKYADNIYWVYGVIIKNKAKLDGKRMIKLLSKYGISCRPFFYPMHKQPILRKLGLFKKEKHPVSEKISKYGFYLPSGLGLKSYQIRYISDILHKIKF